MGFRFRRRFTIGAGFRLNLSKSGVSASVGTRGAWFTFGHGKTRETVGLPGTGVSYTEQQSIGAPSAELPAELAEVGNADVEPASGSRVLIWLALLVVVVVAIVLSVTARSA